MKETVLNIDLLIKASNLGNWLVWFDFKKIVSIVEFITNIEHKALKLFYILTCILAIFYLFIFIFHFFLQIGPYIIHVPASKFWKRGNHVAGILIKIKRWCWWSVHLEHLKKNQFQPNKMFTHNEHLQ